MRLLFISLFIGASLLVNGQQFLWSSTSDTTIKWGDRIDSSDIVSEVMTFYGHYEYHYDATGYSKTGFVKQFESSQSFKNIDQNTWKELKARIQDIKNLTVLAFKYNEGIGSSVIVICISDENVDMIVFSNNVERGFIFNRDRDREKFIKWVERILT